MAFFYFVLFCFVLRIKWSHAAQEYAPGPQSGKHWKHHLRKLKSSSEKMTPRTARPLQWMRLHRTPGHTVPAGHWRGMQRSHVGPAGWVWKPRDPQAPAGEAECQLGLPPTWPSRPSRGGGEEGRAPVPRAAEVPCLEAAPPARDTRHPCLEAVPPAGHTRHPAARLRGRLQLLHREGSAEPPTPLPRKADSRHPRSATQALPGGAPHQLGPQRPPCHLLQASGSATPKQSPRCVSQLRAKAPENPSCLFHGGPRAHGGENSSCPGGALKPPLERN